jgi:hypothetical protein
MFTETSDDHLLPKLSVFSKVPGASFSLSDRVPLCLAGRSPVFLFSYQYFLTGGSAL